MLCHTHAEKCSILLLGIVSCRNPWLWSVITIYGAVCVQLAHFTLGDWKDISIAHVIIIIKSEVWTLHIVIIFFRGCVPEMFVTSYSVTCCIYMQGKPGFCFHHYCAIYDECKYSDTFWVADRARFFVHYTISLSSLCKLIWRHWTYKMPVRYVLSSVWVRLSIFSQLSIIQYMGLCVFSLSISLAMIELIYILSMYLQMPLSTIDLRLCLKYVYSYHSWWSKYYIHKFRRVMQNAINVGYILI